MKFPVLAFQEELPSDMESKTWESEIIDMQPNQLVIVSTVNFKRKKKALASDQEDKKWHWVGLWKMLLYKNIFQDLDNIRKNQP